LSLSCSSSHRNLDDSSRSHFFDAIFLEHNYGRLFDQWTQRERTQSEYDITLLADVTFWNEYLQRAYVQEMVKHFRLTETEAKVLAHEQALMHENYFVFIISATARDPKSVDFASNKSLWRLSLEDVSGERRTGATRMEHISYRDERARYFYPRMNRFNETYRVFFPKHLLADQRELKLHISGPRGALRFQFTVPEPLSDELPQFGSQSSRGLTP